MTGMSFKEIKELQEKFSGDLDHKKKQLFALIIKYKPAKNLHDQRCLNSQESKETGGFCRHYRRRHRKKLTFYCAFTLFYYRPLCYEHLLYPD